MAKRKVACALQDSFRDAKTRASIKTAMRYFAVLRLQACMRTWGVRLRKQAASAAAINIQCAFRCRRARKLRRLRFTEANNVIKLQEVRNFTIE